MFEELYPELREIAGRIFRSRRGHHTLQATALVNEAWLKMMGKGGEYADRTHFLAVAATAMRQILVNHARDRNALKRGGGVDRERVTLSGVIVPAGDGADVLAVDEALRARRSSGSDPGSGPRRHARSIRAPRERLSKK